MAHRVAVLEKHLSRKGPLSGFRVVDASQMISGPMGCVMLADQGADVIKVEPLTGDHVRAMSGKGMSSTFCTVNRNKRALAVDLKSEAGREILYRLVRTADVFVQNFRPGAADRIGIGYERLKKEKPDLIYLSISGFGEKGPYSHKRVYDPVIQAVSGLASIQADETGRPRMMRLIVPDKVTALTAAQAITAALLERTKTGKGQHVKLSMLDAVAYFLWAEGMAAHTFVEENAEMAKLAKGGFYSRDLIFKLKDGYITCGTVTMKEWQGLCKALGRDDWLQDPRFQTVAGLIANRDLRVGMIQETLGDWSCDKAVQQLDAHQVPCIKVTHPRSDLLKDPQLLVNESLVDHRHPQQGLMRFAKPAARFTDPFEVYKGAPLIGEDTVEVLRGLDYSQSDIDRLRRSGTIR